LCFLITPLIASVWALTAFWLGLICVRNVLDIPLHIFPALYFPAGYCLILNPRKSKPGFSVFRLFGLCYAMDGGYKGWNPYRERHLAIFVNYFCSRAN
jgi:hypothetical protein